MLLLGLQFVGGLVLLLAGGQGLVRGAATIARSLGVPAVVVGMTVVAFGTSAPELVVAITGAARDAGGVAFGNVAGANIINIALILGVTAVVVPLRVNATIAVREIPMLLLAMSAVLVLSLDEVLGTGGNRLERGDGLVLGLLFAVFLYYTVLAVRRARKDTFVQEARETAPRRLPALAKPLLLVLLGLAGLGLGGNLLVDAAVELAGRLGMTPAAIGLTIVAIGTTLPELVTSLMAARRGEADLAVGNVVGSNIFNILMVLGVASTMRPMDVPDRGPVSLAIGAALTVLLLMLVGIGKLQIRRGEGLLLLASFGGYMAWVLLA